MGDNIHLGDRDGVRTPMQWSPDRNGGFSRADPAALVLPAIMDPLYGYETVNVEAQTRDPHSLLHWMRRMLAVRRSHAAFGRGTLALPLSEEPQGPGLSARARRRDHPVRRQRLAHAAGGRARPLRIRRPRAGRAERRLAVPADRPAHLSADPAALRLLLVHAAERERARRPGTRRRPSRCPTTSRWCCASGSPRRSQRRRRRPRARRAAAPICRSGAGSPPRTRASSPRASPITAPLPGGDRELLLAEIETKTDGATQPLAAAARRSCWEDEPSAAAAGAARAGARAARPPRRPADRRLRAAGLRPPDARRAGATARRIDDRRRARSSSSRSPGNAEAAAPAAPTRRCSWLSRRAIQQLADRRRRRDAEDLPPHRRRRASRGRDGPLSDRARLRQRAAAARARSRASTRRASAIRSPSRRASCATRATPGPGRSTSSTAPLDDLGDAARRRRARPTMSRTTRRFAASDRPAARRDARRAGARRPTIRPSRRDAPTARTSRAGSRGRGAARRARSTSSPRARLATNETDRGRMPSALLADREALVARAATAGASRRRQR